MITATSASRREQLQQQKTSGAHWFYWIAGLSLLNSFLMYTGNTVNFILGLGMMQVIDALMLQPGSALALVGLFLDVCVAALLVGIGYAAHRRQGWFVVGMGIYALDGGLFVLAEDWLGLALHAFVLWCLWNGYRAARQLAALPELQEGVVMEPIPAADTVELPMKNVA